MNIIMPNYYYFKYKRNEIWYIILRTFLIIITIVPVAAIDLVLLVLIPIEFINRTFILLIASLTGVAYALYLELALDFYILEFIQVLFIQLGTIGDTNPCYWNYYYGESLGDGWHSTIIEYGADFLIMNFKEII